MISQSEESMMKCSRTNSICITREFTKNAESQASPQTYCSKIGILTRFLDGLNAYLSLNARAMVFHRSFSLESLEELKKYRSQARACGF